jgi:hypothetical protein
MEYTYIREHFYNRSDELKDQHIKDIKDLIYFFKDKLNLKMHIQYGTLLGAVRNKDFISYDKDIDLSYISNYHTKEEVKKEIISIAEVLKKEEMLIKDFNNRGQMHIRVPNGKFVVDVFTSWVENDKYYLVPFGEICSASYIYPFKIDILRNVDFLIPNKSEELLDILYKDWNNSIKKEDNYLKLPKRSILR